MTTSPSLFNPKMMNPIRELLNPASKLDPQPWLQHMRNHEPIRYDELRDSWDVFRHEDVVQILNDTRTFSSRRMPEGSPATQMMVFMDPPRHTALRHLVAKAFTPKRIADLAPRMEALVEELLAERSDGAFDLVTDLGEALPVIVIAEMLGVSPQDRKQFREWASHLVRSADSYEPAAIQQLMQDQAQASAQLAAYCARMVAERRLAPQDDLITALAEAEIDGQKLSETELLSFCVLLLTAGSETTTHLIANAMRCLLEHPGLEDRLRRQPDLIPSFIEEVLRYKPSVLQLERVCTQDTELHGHTIRQGQGVVVWVASANRDPERFPQPDVFDIERHPNPHLTFGLNVHFCLGAPLARLEAQIAYQVLLRRFHNFQLAPGVQLQPVHSQLVNGLHALPIVCQPL